MHTVKSFNTFTSPIIFKQCHPVGVFHIPKTMCCLFYGPRFYQDVFVQISLMYIIAHGLRCLTKQVSFIC